MDLKKIKIKDFIYYEETTSTSDEVLKLAKNNQIEEYSVCFAENQTKGRGRLRKTWRTIPKHSLAFSFLLTEDFIPQTSLVICTSVHKVLKENYKLDVKIKWPNDIYLNNKKISGILIESYPLKQKRIYIVGIGLNVNKPDYNVEDFIGFVNNNKTKIAREDILNDIFFQIKSDIKKLKEEGFDIFKEYFMDNCLNLNKEINVNISGELERGIFCGINSQGNLILKQKDTIVKIPAGEILQEK